MRWRVFVDGWQIIFTELTNESLVGRLVFELIDSILTIRLDLATMFAKFFTKAAEILKM